MTHQRAPHLVRDPALDGLRGLAALAVVVAHLGVHWGMLPWPALGGIGVLTFFVLSGYLIARLSLRMDGTWSGYRAFLGRRLVRLGPAMVALSVVVPVGLWMDGSSAGYALLQGARTVGQLTGFSTAFEWQIHPTVGPTWSLTTEWMFYLLFPLGIMLSTRRMASMTTRLRGSLLAAGVLYVASMGLSHVQFYSLPVANVAVMCVGAALAFAHKSGWRGPSLITDGPAPAFALATFLIFILLPGSSASWGYRLFVLPGITLASAVMIHGIVHGHRISGVLASRPLVAVGIRAYSLYLWHIPVMWLVWRMVGTQGLGWMLLLGLPLIVAVTAVSFVLFERPVLPSVTTKPQREMTHR